MSLPWQTAAPITTVYKMTGTGIDIFTDGYCGDTNTRNYRSENRYVPTMVDYIKPTECRRTRSLQPFKNKPKNRCDTVIPVTVPPPPEWVTKFHAGDPVKKKVTRFESEMVVLQPKHTEINILTDQLEAANKKIELLEKECNNLHDECEWRGKELDKMEGGINSLENELGFYRDTTA
jgi:hypothetical protein